MSIKVGDLVMVVKPTTCCGNPARVGKIFEVQSIETLSICCQWCGDLRVAMTASDQDDYARDINRLIKIDPPSLPESLEREKELSV